MKVLLDTHTLIWFTDGVSKLSLRAKSEIEDLNNERFLSIVSLWEIAIKSSRGKLELKKSFKELNKFIFDNDIQIITVQLDHLMTLLELPHHHGDPFDRLLIAQALTEDLTIISADKEFQAYPVRVSW
jgi:PIN domain nuclease of toxin-antitoxin system